jgi:hypothetical protein
LEAHLPDGTVQPLIRLRYGGSAQHWGFGLYLASSDRYENQILPSGFPSDSPEELPQGTTKNTDHQESEVDQQGAIGVQGPAVSPAPQVPVDLDQHRETAPAGHAIQNESADRPVWTACGR